MAALRPIRLLHSPTEVFQSGHIVTIDTPDEVHRIRTVLRASVGTPATIVDPSRRQAASGKLVELSKQRVLVALNHVSSPSPLPRSITLAPCLLKETQWDWLLQKATELGATRIQPVFSEYTTVKPPQAEKKYSRWQGVIERATLQCESLWLPTLEPVQPLCSLLKEPLIGKAVVLMERSEHTSVPHLKEVLREMDVDTPLTVHVGPEGGWSPVEREQFEQNSAIQAAHLGARILRAETSVLTAIAMLL